MPALNLRDDNERLWRDLLRQADSLTASSRWPSVPGCELWAYDAADRVAHMFRNTPELQAMPYELRRKRALRIHRGLSWQTALGRSARFNGRLQRVDAVAPGDLPVHFDVYALHAITPEAIAHAFMHEGVPAMRARAIAERIAHDTPWEEIRGLLAATAMRPPSAATLRTQCARDLKNHGDGVAGRLGIEPPSRTRHRAKKGCGAFATQGRRAVGAERMARPELRLTEEKMTHAG